VIAATNSALDWERGYDFMLNRTSKYGFPCYEGSKFLQKSCPAGTPEQIELWKQQIDKMSIPSEKDNIYETRHEQSNC
jgi:hypothetical protein